MMLKRALDIMFSAAGLVVLFPLLVIIAILIKSDSSGPVFFRQKRIGRHFIPFDLYKFRSMVTDAPRMGPGITAGHDPRITRIGRVLRKTKIDELPQLLNVLKGDMSLVGPRPELTRYVELFKDDFAEVLTVQPGITDYASIRYRDEESILASYADPVEGYVNDILPAKLALNKQYVRDRSLWVDVGIIFRTLYAIVQR
jgi:lipopolysaccharide/colanic/teichoic acid biosynthesis glycosyltransferase